VTKYKYRVINLRPTERSAGAQSANQLQPQPKTLELSQFRTYVHICVNMELEFTEVQNNA